MDLKTANPTSTKTWQQLADHYEEIKKVSIKEMFAAESNRMENFNLEWNGFLVDFSKNRITYQTMHLLRDFAVEMDLADAINKYFDGDAINKTENRPVLHTALRASSDTKIYVDNENIIPTIDQIKSKMRRFSSDIILGERKGYSGKKFTDVVNIGIGGSDLGPAMITDALAFYQNHLRIHFVSNVDGDHIAEVLSQLNPETTLFVIVSKTFTTQETLTNSETIRKWFLKSASQKDIASHFVAVSSNIENAVTFGIHADNIFPIWDWVGGRFSLWSAVGLTISIAIGFDNFEQLLLGANEMDHHFKNTSFDQNIPVTLALIGIWYNNFHGCQSEAIIPYSQYLKKFAPYLQQSVMESNGKSIDRNGNAVDYQTGSIIWGEPGTNAQHAFFQLLHQGTKLIPTDFIGFTKPLHGNEEHHDILMSNFFAQTEALMNGKSASEVALTTSVNFLGPFKVFEGNKPTNTILIDKLTPKSLGALVAMYEHKIFVQGILWNIFSFDQWGVELGKHLASSILSEIKSGIEIKHDVSTRFLLNHYRHANSNKS